MTFLASTMIEGVDFVTLLNPIPMRLDVNLCCPDVAKFAYGNSDRS